jgi:membrane protein DedA with SNARE-associated domain
VWTSVGYLSGSHIDAIYRAATRYDAYLAIAVAALLLVYLATRLKRRRAGASPQRD